MEIASPRTRMKWKQQAVRQGCLLRVGRRSVVEERLRAGADRVLGGQVAEGSGDKLRRLGSVILSACEGSFFSFSWIINIQADCRSRWRSFATTKAPAVAGAPSQRRFKRRHEWSEA